MKICMISDTHCKHWGLDIPKCDVLIHAGDITQQGDIGSFEDFNVWIRHLRDENIIHEAVVIAGNHDIALDGGYVDPSELLSACTYLDNSGTYIGDTYFWGIPHSKTFGRWAFGCEEDELSAKFSNVPEDTDILVTHGPALGVLDKAYRGDDCGSQSLLTFIEERRPPLVVCGHIHEGRGLAKVGSTLVVNAASTDFKYSVIKTPITLDIKEWW